MCWAWASPRFYALRPSRLPSPSNLASSKGMTTSTDATERLAKQADRELEQTVRASLRANHPDNTLAHLLSAFDARRRQRETMALRACVPAIGKS